jgi:hypothetical protein
VPLVAHALQEGQQRILYARRQAQFDASETKTPCAAALAGLLFTVLFTSSYVLIRLSIPANPADAGAWLAERAGTVSLALGLLPFAGIAFLWFIGVVRDRLGPALSTSSLLDELSERRPMTVVFVSGAWRQFCCAAA